MRRCPESAGRPAPASWGHFDRSAIVGWVKRSADPTCAGCAHRCWVFPRPSPGSTRPTFWEDAMHTVSRRVALAGLAFFALWPGPAGAQEQTLKIVIPFAAGGGAADAITR